MRLGAIVKFKGSNWVLINRVTKKASGVVEEKVFYLLPPKENFYEDFKPFTREREKLPLAEEKNLNKVERAKYREFQRAGWVLRVN